jgi:hypothetical protein
METQIQEPQYAQVPLEPIAAFPSSESANLAMLPPATTSEGKYQEVGRKVSNFLEQLPTYIARFFQEYKLPVISFGLLVAAITTLKIAVAVLGAINDIPLVYPFFELVGISYAAWFTFRYLLKASTRQELVSEISSYKKQIFGADGSDSPPLT